MHIHSFLVKYKNKVVKIDVDYNYQFTSSAGLSGIVIKQNKLIACLLIDDVHEVFAYKPLSNMYEHVPNCDYDGRRVINVFSGGGLGNQLWQYTFCQFLTKAYPNSKICYNTTWFKKQGHDHVTREYHLDKFKLNDNVKLSTVLDNYITLNNVAFESSMHGVRDNLDATLSKQDDVALSGYWQRWEYVKDNLDNIRDYFTLKDDITDETFLNFKNVITSSKHSCSIHIRRTDYLDNKKVYAILDVDYYVKAIEYIRQLYNNDVQFFCFSDDIEWCKIAFKNIEGIHYISDTKSDIHDFELMKICHDNIIANSTFSWWAAILNSNQDKVVIAPKVWYTFEHELFQFGCDGRCILL